MRFHSHDGLRTRSHRAAKWQEVRNGAAGDGKPPGHEKCLTEVMAPRNPGHHRAERTDAVHEREGHPQGGGFAFTGDIDRGGKHHGLIAVSRATAIVSDSRNGQS